MKKTYLLLLYLLLLLLLFVYSCGQSSEATTIETVITETKEINTLQKYLLQSVEKLKSDTKELPYSSALIEINPKLSPFELIEINMAISHASIEYSVPPQLIIAIIKSESGGDPKAYGRDGEIGLMQPLVITAKKLKINPRQPYENIMGCTRFLRDLLDKFDNDLVKSLTAYNAGENNIKLKLKNPKVKEHVKKVLSEYAYQVWKSKS